MVECYNAIAHNIIFEVEICHTIDEEKYSVRCVQDVLDLWRIESTSSLIRFGMPNTWTFGMHVPCETDFR